MSTWMALFGLLWLLRLRGSLCGCAACKRARRDPHEAPILLTPRSPSLEDQAAFDVIALQQFTRDVCVQTDFKEEEAEEDLDKIELQITEDSNVGNYESGRKQATAQSPRIERRAAGNYQCQPQPENDPLWETVDVTLERGATGLGLSIAGGAAGSDVTITRIAAGGSARRDGRLQVGDILLQVNDIRVEGAPHSVAVDILQKAGNIVTLRIRRARRPRVVSLWRGARGLGLGIAGGSDHISGGGGIFISYVAVGGAAHHDGRLRIGDKILAVRDEDGIETSLIGATHAQAVEALRNAGQRVSLVVLPAGSVPLITRTAPLINTRTQATSCSTLHELLEEEPSEIPRCVRMVRLIRTGSRLGMDIVGGLGAESDGPSTSEEDPSGVFVSGVSPGGSAYGMLHRGDRILSVDGQDLTRATHEQAAIALKQYSGSTVTIAAQYQPEQYERIRARIREINAAAVMSPHVRQPTPQAHGSHSTIATIANHPAQMSHSTHQIHQAHVGHSPHQSRPHAMHIPVHPQLHTAYPR